MNGSASMMQLKRFGNVVQALQAMVSAESLSSADGKRLTELVQSSIRFIHDLSKKEHSTALAQLHCRTLRGMNDDLDDKLKVEQDEDEEKNEH